MLKEFEGHYCKIMKYDFLEVEFLQGAIIARMGKDDLYSGNMQSILQGAGVCQQGVCGIEEKCGINTRSRSNHSKSRMAIFRDSTTEEQQNLDSGTLRVRRMVLS